MATKTKMVVKTTKKKMDGGDKNEPGKNPKPQLKPKMSTVGKSTVSTSNTKQILKDADARTNVRNTTTNKIQSKKDAMNEQRQKEYRKNAGYKS